MEERKTGGQSPLSLRWMARSAGTLFLAAILTGPALPARAATTAELAEKGEGIFQQKCSSCHTVGGGKLVGPDLQGVTSRRDRNWLARFIVAPDEMLAAKDPVAVQLFSEYQIPMPNLDISKEDAVALLAFLEAPEEVKHHVAPAAEVKAPAPKPNISGDPGVGRGLFTGAISFQNKGAPCMACHGAGRVAALGGGALGPDLTPVFKNYGDAGMDSVLQSLPFPTMQPIYGSRPLTAEERAHLKAFFAEAGSQSPPQGAVGFGLFASGIFLAFLLLPHLIWRKRLQEVRKRLVRSSYER